MHSVALFTKNLVILCDSFLYFTLIYLYFHFLRPYLDYFLKRITPNILLQKTPNRLYIQYEGFFQKRNDGSYQLWSQLSTFVFASVCIDVFKFFFLIVLRELWTLVISHSQLHFSPWSHWWPPCFKTQNVQNTSLKKVLVMHPHFSRPEGIREAGLCGLFAALMC